MGKLLSWVVLVMLAWLVLRLAAISQRRRERSQHNGATAKGSASTGAVPVATPGEKIMPCAHCGLFVPVSDLVHDGDAVYCSTAHRAAARAGGQSAFGADDPHAPGRTKS